MIVSKDTTPGNDLYYLGAKVLECLTSFENKDIDYISLLNAVKKEVNISNNLFALSLNWLFLLSTIDLTEQGDIKKCF